MRTIIRYLHRGEVVTAEGFAPTATLLDHLRLSRGLTGTKEGCGEGDCGACTVALGRLEGGERVFRPVNACIQLLGQIDGAELVTVEDLAEGETLHPVQQAMVDHHGAQCGFCTPGIVMSLFTLYHDSETPVDRAALDDRLSGNLCRCTGYAPIASAMLSACADRPAGKAHDHFARDAGTSLARLAALWDDKDVFIGDDTRFFAAPRTLESLFALLAAHPEARLVAGNTDVGLWITKRLMDLPKIIHLGRVSALAHSEETAHHWRFGATCTFQEVADSLSGRFDSLDTLFRRIGSRQVRASGTIGGNIANGSPIGDSPPALIALGARLVLDSAGGRRDMPLEDFFIAYGEQARRKDEIVSAVIVPKPAPDLFFFTAKIAKRYDQDITSALGAFAFTLNGTSIIAARIAYGGMAGTPKRASTVEKALVGLDLSDTRAFAALPPLLEKDYTPLSDMRASSAYRMDAAKALLLKALHGARAQALGLPREPQDVALSRPVEAAHG